MKKLLSLLSILTISGTAMPTVIAVSSYQKEEKIENINNKINYSQQNNLYQLNRIKKQNNKKINILEKIKIVIRTNGSVRSTGVIFNNKLYIGSFDNNVYEYDTVTGQQKIVIRTNGQIWSSGLVFNNKLYFGSFDHKVYEYDPITQQQKIVIRTNGSVLSAGVVLHNKLYLGSHDGSIYEYDPATEQQKIVIRTNSKVNSSGIVLNNKLYFGSHDHNVYEYDPATEQQKIVIRTPDIVFSSGVVFNNKLYFGSDDDNIYEYDPITQQQKIVIRTNGNIASSGVVFNNKLYFGSGDNNIYEYDPITQQQKIVIRTNGNVQSSGLIFDNKLYFGSRDGNIYEYDSITQQQKIIIRTKDIVWSSGLVFNNKIYFGSRDGNVYEYTNYYNNLGQINNNSDNTILSELNYLNPDLDISQLEIVNKTNISVTIKAKNNSNKYFGENKVYYTINQQNKIINLNELIKKAIFFKFRDENPNLKFKEVNYINNNDLSFWKVEVTRDSKLLHSVDFNDKCFKKRERTNNNFSDTKTIKIPKCEYNTKSKLSFQITKGLNRTEQENKLTGWNINLDDEIKLSDFININNKNYEIINELSNNFDLSNTNKQEQEIILQPFSEIEDEIEIAPLKRIVIKYSVREINLKIILNLKQKITGTIRSLVINNDNELYEVRLSIKEAMQILQKYSLLPDEITINEDNSITFNGKAKITLIQESKPQLITKISNL